jgi:TRAP-type C4-dicarboxylate transport system permease large subunit
MVTALGFGFITPPMGLNLFVVSGLTGTPIMSVARAALPFVLAMVVVTILVAFVPDLSLWLLRRG